MAMDNDPIGQFLKDPALECPKCAFNEKNGNSELCNSCKDFKNTKHKECIDVYVQWKEYSSKKISKDC